MKKEVVVKKQRTIPKELVEDIIELLIDVNFILCEKNCDNSDLVKKSEKILKKLGVYNDN